MAGRDVSTASGPERGLRHLEGWWRRRSTERAARAAAATPASDTATARIATPVTAPVTEPRRVVIVGNGMVSHSLCDALTAPGVPIAHALTVLGEEPYLAYDRVHLSSSASHAPALLASAAWYTERGIELRTGACVSSIDREARRVRLADGSTVPYDTLVLATGAAPRLPSCPGLDGPNVFAYRSFDDVVQIRVAAQGVRRAAVVGGGLLGLEAAQLLRDAGVEVTVIEASRQLMPRQLDADSALVLQARVEALDVRLRMSAQLTEIVHGADAMRLHFAEGEAIDAELTVIAIGVQPRDELARGAELLVGARGGVLVDDALCTSDPRVFAIGDCACHRGKCYGLIAPGVQMARVVAANLLGAQERFERADLSCELKLLGVPVHAVGDYDREAHVVSAATEHGRYNLLLDSRRLVGATAVGDWPELPRLRLLAEAHEPLSHLQLRRFARTGRLLGNVEAGVASWPEAALVCNCRRVSRGALTVLASQCAGDVERLCTLSGAGTVCGSCKPLVAELAGVTALPVRSRSGRVLLGVSVAAALVCAALLLGPGLPAPDSVLSERQALHALFERDDYRQYTGFTLLGIAAASLVLSLRKRTRALKRLSFGGARAVHAVLGVLSLLGLVAHTRLHIGSNLNLALLLCFVGAAFAGSLAGAATSLEASRGVVLARPARRARSPLTRLHVIWLWPLPVLLGAHVFAAYYF